MPTQTATVSQDLFDTIFATPAETPAATQAPTPAVESTPLEAVVATKVEPVTDTEKRTLSEEEVQASVFGEALEEVPAAKVTPATKAPTPVQAAIEEPEEEVSEEDYTKQVLTQLAKKLIKSGRWQDVEDFDQLDLDEDGFEELAKMQDEYRLGNQWNSIKQSSPLVNDILDIVEQNGNPEQIVNLFRSQQELTTIETDTVEGKKELIAKYYDQIAGYPKAEITRRLKKLDLDGEEEINAEFSIANQKYGEYFEKEKTRIKETETQRVQAEEAAKRAKLEASVKFLRDQKTPDSQIRSQLQAIYQPAYKLKNGEMISELDYKLLEVRNDPKETLELAQFILDKENYLKKKTTTATNEVVDQQFQKLKFKPRPTSTTSGSAPVGRPAKSTTADLYKPFL